MQHPFKDAFSTTTFLEKDASGRIVDRRLRICVAVLLWEMANIDGNRSDEEFSTIVRSIDHEFHFTDTESGEVISAAAYLKQQQVLLERIVAEINDGYSIEQRRHLFDLILDVAEADNHVVPSERALAIYLKEKLKLPRDW